MATDGERTTYSYDDANRVETLENPDNETSTFTYNNAGRRTLKKLANATRASFSYDGAGRLSSLYNLKSDSSVISSFDYGYDNVGNRQHVAEAGGDRVTWTYDDTNQLTAEHRSGASAYSHTFSYDPNGNRLVQDTSTELTTSTFDAANRLLTAEDNSGVTTYAYDADGNQQTKEAPNGDVTTNTWSYENKLTQIEEPTGDTTDYTFATVQKNGTEQRVSKDDGVDVTRFVWDGKQMLLEVTDAGVIEARYDYTPDSFGDLVSQHQNLETNYHHFDGLGSTSDLTDSAEVVTDDYAYEAFGKEVATTGTTPNPHRWVGELGYYRDEESALYSLQQRMYDTGTGRFQSEDPIAKDENNLYRYVGNNPTNFIDPNGLGPILFGPTSPSISEFSGLAESSPPDILESLGPGPIEDDVLTATPFEGPLSFSSLSTIYDLDLPGKPASNIPIVGLHLGTHSSISYEPAPQAPEPYWLDEYYILTHAPTTLQEADELYKEYKRKGSLILSSNDPRLLYSRRQSILAERRRADAALKADIAAGAAEYFQSSWSWLLYRAELKRTADNIRSWADERAATLNQRAVATGKPALAGYVGFMNEGVRLLANVFAGLVDLPSTIEAPFLHIGDSAQKAQDQSLRSGDNNLIKLFLYYWFAGDKCKAGLTGYDEGGNELTDDERVDLLKQCLYTTSGNLLLIAGALKPFNKPVTLKPKPKPPAPKGIGKLKGFSKAEKAMIRKAEKALADAGYDVSKFRELIRADMPSGFRGMSLDKGAALGKEAFSSQRMLNHVLEEEFLHLQQKAAGLGKQFGPGTAQGLEEAADAARKFPCP